MKRAEKFERKLIRSEEKRWAKAERDGTLTDADREAMRQAESDNVEGRSEE